MINRCLIIVMPLALCFSCSIGCSIEFCFVFFIVRAVPPKQIKVTDSKGVDIDEVIGPFDEDSPIALVCVVIGGTFLFSILDSRFGIIVTCSCRPLKE